MAVTASTHQNPIEDVQSFRLRARAWLAATMPRIDDEPTDADPPSDEASWQRARELQKLLYRGGFAGICYPTEYGGLGLSPDYQAAFNEECVGYEMPLLLNVPTFSICGPTILDMGSEEQKRTHLPRVIAGDEVLVQFLSESRGGSDLAGVTTRATRDGDVFIVNGEKIWSSGAYAADYALCLTRTDWQAPKHRGMTMLLVKVHQPGLQIRRIRQVNGNDEFCQEFFDDVEVPVGDVVGEINGGWAVASRQLFHERNAVGGGSPYVSGPAQVRGDLPGRGETRRLIDLAEASGGWADPRARELVAEHHVLGNVRESLIDRVRIETEAQRMPVTAGAVIRLFSAEVSVRRAEIELDLAGSSAVTAEHGRGADVGVQFLFRQAACLGGGSTEMARNIISERILGMPREFAADRDLPFADVRQGR